MTQAPTGWTKIDVEEVYLYNGEIIVMGMPGEDEEETHNCDVMGCSSVSHVLYRGIYKEGQR